MKPTLFLPFIHTYGVMLAVGFYAGWWLAARRARAENVDPDTIGNLVLISIVAGVIGSRAVWFLFYRSSSESWWVFFEVWKGGLVFYGGLIGAVLAGYVYLRWRGAEIWHVADLAAPGVAIGQAFGRIGCFLNGCCHGGVASAAFPIAVSFPPLRDEMGVPTGAVFRDHANQGWILDNATASLPVHPAQLYASASLFLITALLLVATRYKRRHGEILALVFILNAVSRLGMELIRRDVPPTAFGLTAGQMGAAAVLAVGVGLFVWMRRRGKPVAWEAEEARG